MRTSIVTKIVLCAATCCVLSFLAAAPALADNVYGKIRGTVTDPTGAVIGGAKITATNTATGISTTVTSKGDGGYEFLDLAAPANYTVKVEQPGFRAFEAQGISLSLDQVYELNVKLEVGTVTQEVTVQANPAQINTTNMQLGATLNAAQVTDLPLNGRNWVQLQQTLPGVVSSSDRFNTNYSTNGSRTQANNFLVNGVDANDLPLNSPQVIPSPDAIAEVSMVSNTIAPEYGRNGGAIMNAATKSGSNQFHGDAFEFYRDTSLNTRQFFACVTSGCATVYHQNQFGGVIGGPIKPNKLFFFFSYQGTRNRRLEPGSSGTDTVFTQAERNGDFSADGPLIGTSPFRLTGEDGTVYPANTPYTTLFPTSHIPVVDFNSIAVNLTNTYVPLPNIGGNTYSFSAIQTQSINQYLGRIDYTVRPSDTLWGSFFVQPQTQQETLPFTGALLPGFGDQAKSQTQQYVLNWTHTFGGSMVNELRFGYQRLNLKTVFPINPILPSALGFTGINPQYAGALAGAPLITITGGPTLGFSNNGPQPRIDQTYQLTDNFSKIVGRHTLKFGFSMLRSQVSNPFAGNNNGNFTFGGSGTYTTSIANADFFLGIPDSYLQGSGGFIDARTQTYYMYAQDQFKMRSNLTMTYGLGWEIDTPIHNLQYNGVGVNCFLPGEQSTVFPGSPTGLVFPGDPRCNNGGGVTTRYDHFAPRFGVVYSPGSSGKWSISAGFGVYFNRTEEELALQNLGAIPFSVNSSGATDYGGSPGFAQPFTDVATGTAYTNKFPFVVPKPGSNPDFAFFEPFSINVIDPNTVVPYTMNYHFDVQRQLSPSTVLTVAYVGLVGHHLTNAIELNPAGNESGNAICVATPGCDQFNNFITAPQSFRYPQVNANGALIFASVGQQGTFINSNYNGLQVSVDKKLSHNLAFRAAYTWGHSLDGSSSFEDLGFSGVRGLDPFNPAANYGDSAYDARKRFVISYNYEIPTRWKSGVGGVLTNGWNLSGITTFQSGFPATIGDAGARSYTCDASYEYYSCWDRPNTLSSVATYNVRTATADNSLGGTRPPRGVQNFYYFNPNAFGREDLGTMGNAGRNFFHGPGINNWDLAFRKVTNLHSERAQLELRFEFFNIWNHAQFAGQSSSQQGVNTNSNSRNFGRDLSAQPPGISSRIIQLGAKIIF